MEGSNIGATRRNILTASAGWLLFPRLGRTAPATGIIDLDTRSIRLKDPAHVLFVAITQAGNRLIAVGEHGVIVFSDDDGYTWVQAQTPVNVTLTCVAFATALIGWSAGHFGVILATSDGGQSWEIQLNGIQANQLMLAAAQDPSVAAGPCPCAPLALRRANHFMDQGPAQPFLTLLVFSSEHMIAFGAYRMAVMTQDGGKSWVDWSLHIYDEYSHNIYAAATIGGRNYLVGEQGMVFCSTDAGNSFLPLAPTSPITLFGILGAPDGTLIVFGVAGVCYRSIDNGKAWTSISIGSQDDITAGLVLRSGAILLSSEAGALFKSTDNGATFNVVSGVAPLPFFDLEDAANGDLIIAGAAGITRIAAKFLNT